MPMGLQPPLHNILRQPFHPDSNSKVIGNGEGLGDETTDSISSVLRKEIEGKSLFQNLMCLSPLLKVKTH